MQRTGLVYSLSPSLQWKAPMTCHWRSLLSLHLSCSNVRCSPVQSGAHASVSRSGGSGLCCGQCACARCGPLSLTSKRTHRCTVNDTQSFFDFLIFGKARFPEFSEFLEQLSKILENPQTFFCSFGKIPKNSRKIKKIPKDKISKQGPAGLCSAIRFRPHTPGAVLSRKRFFFGGVMNQEPKNRIALRAGG